MKTRPTGLTEVQDRDLKKLLGHLHSGELRFPLDIGELTRVGLQHCASHMLGHLRGLDNRGVQQVVVAVIAERAKTGL